MAFDPAQPIQIKVEILVGSLGWVDITARGRAASCAIQQGRSANAIQAEGSRLSLEVGNPDGYLTEGNAISPWYPYIGRGCPIRVSRLGLTVSPAQRFYGRIDTMQAHYPGGNVDSTMSITAVGTLGTLGQSTDPLRSPMFRGIPDTSPLAWWPLESDAKSGLSGGTTMVQNGQVNFGANGNHPGSASLPDFTGGGSLSAPLPNGASSTSWRVEFTARFGTGADSVQDFTAALDVNSPSGDVNAWEFFVTDAATVGSAKAAAFQWSNTSGSYTDLIQTDALVDDGMWHHFRADVAQSGGNISVTFTVDGVVAGTKTLVGKNLNSTGSNVVVNPLREKADHVASVGHVTWWAPYAAVGPDTSILATGWTGETAADRLSRLCGEEGLGFTLTGTASDTPAMGPQLIDTLVNNLRDCERVDQGLLHDNGTSGALGYVTLTSLYNKAAGIAVVKGAIQPDLSPLWDNQYTVNDVTSTRPDGGWARVADETHVTATGTRFRDSRTVNVETDDQLPHDAGWAVHVGTAPGARYNAVGINLRNPDGALLADAVAGHAIGDRITVAQAALPSQHPVGGIDALTVGWTELLDADTWVFRPNVIPYSVYYVAKLDDTTLGRLGTGGATVSGSDLTTAGTSFTFTNSDGVLFTTSGGDFPMDIVIAGEQITLSAISGGTNPQTATISRRAVNGVGPKLHPVGTSFQVFRAMVLAR